MVLARITRSFVAGISFRSVSPRVLSCGEVSVGTKCSPATTWRFKRMAWHGSSDWNKTAHFRCLPESPPEAVRLCNGVTTRLPTTLQGARRR